jgi:type IX secretion system PorP/SprF family membrane protein
MKKLVVGLVGLMMLHNAEAQDLHFSQTSQTPLLINPAAAGVFDGWERVIVNHRNQWLGAGTQFMTTNVAADINVGKTALNDRAHFGVGLMFFNDVGGDANFGIQTGALTLSGILPMGGTGHTLSAGIQAGYGMRKADFSRLSFYNQFDGSGFDNTILSGEVNSGTSFTYIDGSAGLYYVYDGGQNTFQRNNDFKIQFGLSGYHLNSPELKYSNGLEGEKLARKYVAHFGVVADIAGSDWAIDGSVLQFKQAGHYETIFGMMMRYRFEDGTKMTGHSHNAYFGFGCYARLKDAIIPSIMVDWKGFQFGVSYDVTVSDLRKAYRGGSLEFSLSYTNRHDALFKTKRRRI